MDKLDWIIASLLTVGFLLVGLLVYVSVVVGHEYSRKCIDVGGKPANNGYFMECLK